MFKLLAGTFLSAAAYAAPVLFAIGANQSGVPNQLVQIDVANSAVNPVVTLGDGSQSFAGGLIRAATLDLFGAFMNSGNGETVFVFLTSTGTITPFLPFPEFSPGGLTQRSSPNATFWTSNDSNGNSTLTGSDPLIGGPIGTGFTGGLAYREANNTLYAIRNDANGNSTLHYFDTASSQMVQLGINLGSGFLGGLAWDPAADLFYAIGSDSNANATLYRFAAGDATATALFGIGQGYLYAALTVLPDSEPAGVPEPSTYLLTAAALLAAALVNRNAR
jgi:hypothetical protein